MHPGLEFNLLEQQIEACREIDVRCPIYISAGLDERMAAERPDWVLMDQQGSIGNPLAAQWHRMRFNSGYLDFLCAQIEEVVRLWPDNDGIFLDIVAARPDYARETLIEMKGMGLDPESAEDMEQYSQHVLKLYYNRTGAAVRSVRKDTPVFQNGGNVPVGAREFNSYNSHFELESLPTGGWGYNHFPISARYVITQPRDFLGMTGKFHTKWGEFGGFKRLRALQYECASMLASGAKCSIGDQLHPNGLMNPDTYTLIGKAYEGVAQKEPWCDNVSSAARIAVISAVPNQSRWRGHLERCLADEGACKMLLELHLPFDLLDEHAEWGGYHLAILPEGLKLTQPMAEKAEAFLNNGGRIIAAADALIDPDKGGFRINPGGVLQGRSSHPVEYIEPVPGTFGNVPVQSPLVIHSAAYEVDPRPEAVVFAKRRLPYFDRTWEHFCSHQHAPESPEPATPAILGNRQLIWFAHDFFSAYNTIGQPLFRDLFEQAVDWLLGDARPVRTVNLPTSARLNILKQTDAERYVLHLLFAPTRLAGEFNGKPIEIIEDLVPLHGTEVELLLPETIKSAKLVPQKIELPFNQESQKVSLTIPEFTCHQMIELAY
jgi:hypothetical protein